MTEREEEEMPVYDVESSYASSKEAGGDHDDDSTDSSDDGEALQKKPHELVKKKSAAKKTKLITTKRKARSPPQTYSSDDDSNHQLPRKARGAGRPKGSKNRATISREKADRLKTAKATALTGRKENACKAGTARPPNFSPYEDQLLCRAYISASSNSVKGSNRKSAEFWRSVSAKYCKLAVETYPDDPKVLQRNDGGNGELNQVRFLLPTFCTSSLLFFANRGCTYHSRKCM